MQADTYLGEDSDPQSLNLYAYCQGNPIMFTDPSGHKTVRLNTIRFRSSGSGSNHKDSNKVYLSKGKATIQYGVTITVDPKTTARSIWVTSEFRRSRWYGSDCIYGARMYNRKLGNNTTKFQKTTFRYYVFPKIPLSTTGYFARIYFDFPLTVPTVAYYIEVSTAITN